MLSRKAFVTNSSSTSFIAWGFPIDRYKIDNAIEREESEDTADKVWDDLIEGSLPVTLETSNDGNAWIVVTDSLLSGLEDESYTILDLVAEPRWHAILGDFCDKYKLECKEPHWFFATAGC